MKSNRIVLKAIAAAVLLSTAGFAAAAGSQDVTVQASVKSVCVLNFLNNGAVVVDFSEIDPSTTGEKTQPIAVPYRCTKNAAAPTITVGGATAMTGPVGGSIAFTMDAFSTAAGAGFSADASATSTVRIPTANYVDQPAGNYSATAVLTITP